MQGGRSGKIEYHIIMEKRRTSHGNARCGDVTMIHDDWSTPLVRAYADEAVWDNIFHPLLTGWFAFDISNPLAPLKLIGVHIEAWIFPERLSRLLDM